MAVTVAVAGPDPAVKVTIPKVTPAGITIVELLKGTAVGLLLVSVTTAPPGGAGKRRPTSNLVVCPVLMVG